MTGIETISATILGLIGTAVWLYIYNKHCKSLDEYSALSLTIFTLFAIVTPITTIGWVLGLQNLIPFIAYGTAVTVLGYFAVSLYFFAPTQTTSDPV